MHSLRVITKHHLIIVFDINNNFGFAFTHINFSTSFYIISLIFIKLSISTKGFLHNLCHQLDVSFRIFVFDKLFPSPPICIYKGLHMLMKDFKLLLFLFNSKKLGLVDKFILFKKIAKVSFFFSDGISNVVSQLVGLF